MLPRHFILRLARLVSIVVTLPAFASEPVPLLPEASDPVLGHRAAVVEWAWSPQYAERFGLPVQEDGLDDGYLWLVGIKVVRMDFHDRPTYRCRIVGLLDNQAPIVWPPGERYVMHPSQLPMGGGLPGQGFFRRESEGKPFTPGNSARRRASADPHGDFIEKGLSAPYRVMHRQYDEGLAYFELDGSCAFFGDPAGMVNQVVFPTRAIPVEGQASAVFEEGSLRIDIPDRVMTKVYPAIRSAADWTTCLSHRSGATRLQLERGVRERLGSVDCSAMKATQ